MKIIRTKREKGDIIIEQLRLCRWERVGRYPFVEGIVPTENVLRNIIDIFVKQNYMLVRNDS